MRNSRLMAVMLQYFSHVRPVTCPNLGSSDKVPRSDLLASPKPGKGAPSLAYFELASPLSLSSSTIRFFNHVDIE